MRQFLPGLKLWQKHTDVSSEGSGDLLHDVMETSPSSSKKKKKNSRKIYITHQCFGNWNWMGLATTVIVLQSAQDKNY